MITPHVPTSLKFSHKIITFRFVTFVTESDARTALALIKNKQFNGSTIKARLKTETMNKSYFRYSVCHY